jgi:Uma2 family endonuclease
MELHVAMPPRSVLVIPDGREYSEDAYLRFCEANPDLLVERNAEGEIIIVPPVGGESDYRNANAVIQLGNWAMKNGGGKAFGSSLQFFLPDGSAFSPDAAWVSNDALNRLTRQQRKEFLRLCPEFVIEVRSPSDGLNRAKAKMERWIANGVQLAWLIDGDAETVYIYQKDRPVETRKGVLKLAGKGPVKGFTLQLRAIWDGLK